MIRVIYNKICEEKTSLEQVMLLVKKINQEQLVKKQLVVIETQNQGVMEIALGMGEESVLFYIPESEEEDIKVSCNELVEKAKTEKIDLSHALDEEVECSICHIVSFEKALMTLEAFLQGKEFMSFVDWYTY